MIRLKYESECGIEEDGALMCGRKRKSQQERKYEKKLRRFRKV
jgi:hypothetical protein